MGIDVSTGNVSTQRWFVITRYYQSSGRLLEDEALAGLDERLRHVVQARIDSSDLEVGTFLSEG